MCLPLEPPPLTLSFDTFLGTGILILCRTVPCTSNLLFFIIIVFNISQYTKCIADLCVLVIHRLDLWKPFIYPYIIAAV